MKIKSSIIGNNSHRFGFIGEHELIRLRNPYLRRKNAFKINIRIANRIFTSESLKDFNE